MSRRVVRRRVPGTQHPVATTFLALASALGAVVALAWGGGPSGGDVGGNSAAPARSSAPAVPSGTADPTPSTTATVTESPAADRLVWADEFSGPAGQAPSPANWQPVTGGGGFGNQELECNTSDPRNSGLDGRGDLVITARYEAGFQCVDGNKND